jgi:hypothetical protein
MEFHPLANVFPMMSDEETEFLGEDMLKHAQRDPIWTYERKILDGRNRYQACLLKGIEPRYAEFRGADPLGFVASATLYRRHLDASQRAMAAAKIATLRDGQRKSGSPIGGATQADAAKMLNVGKRSVERAREVAHHGVPDLVDAVEQGEVKVSAAAEFAKQNPPLDQARLIAEHGSPADAVKATVKAKADPAETKPPKLVPNVTPAASRAEDGVRADRALNQLKGVLRAFPTALNRLGTNPSQVADAVKRLDDEIVQTSKGLRAVALLAGTVAKCIDR